MKKHKNKIIAGIVTAVVLVFVFWWGGNAPGLRGWSVSDNEETPAMAADTAVLTDSKPNALNDDSESVAPESDVQVEEDAKTEEIPVKEKNEPATEENKPQKADNTSMTAEEKMALAEKMAGDSAKAQTGNKEYSQQNGMRIDDKTGMDKYMTTPVPEGKPVPVEPEEAVISDKKMTCTLSVKCDTILDNIAWLDKEKVELVPKDGVIFAEQTVTFYEGESVFNILVREMKRNKIHMEFVNTPIYNSAYIEGINNIYEFDCGELSGWMYKVNDWFPNYGCSRYQLKQGDRVEWLYTCDLGIDIGGYYASRGE